MKAKPILMSTPMVKALLAGTKTQTRRIVKPQPPESADSYTLSLVGHPWHDFYGHNGSELCRVKCPYGKPGDVLYVRETWAELHDECQDPTGIFIYKASYEEVRAEIIKEGKWKPSLFMPKDAARIWLEITDVRVERLNEISLEDARAEGIPELWGEGGISLFPKDEPHVYDNRKTVENYAKLWELINGPGSWDANPFVWCISFKRIDKPQP